MFLFFQRGQVFQIDGILARKVPVLYKLRDLLGEPITGNYYKQELKKTEKPEVFKIERILCKKVKKKKLYYYVKWLYYPPKFNSYIPAESIMTGKHGDQQNPVSVCPSTGKYKLP